MNLVTPQTLHVRPRKQHPATMNGSSDTPFELNHLPPPLRGPLMSLSNSGGVNTIAIPGDSDDETQRESSVRWPSTPVRSQAPSVYSSQASQAIQSSFESPAPSQSSDRLGTQAQWDRRSMEILIKAVISHNPNLARTNSDRKNAWSNAITKFNTVCAMEGLPERSERAIKIKFGHVVDHRKKRNDINIRASGVVEFTSEYEALLDEFIESEAYQPRKRAGKVPAPAVELDREELAQMASDARQTPASRSMSTMSQRRRSHTQSQASESDGDHSFDQQLRKRRKNTTAEAFAALTESTERYREFEQDFKLQQLNLLKVQTEAQTQLSQATLEHNTRIQTELQSKISMLKDQGRRMESMMSSMMSMLQGLAGRSAPPPNTVSVPPTLNTIPQETTPSSQRYRSTSIVSDVSTPSRRRRSSRAPSQPRNGPFGGFH